MLNGYKLIPEQPNNGKALGGANMHLISDSVSAYLPVGSVFQRNTPSQEDYAELWADSYLYNLAGERVNARDYLLRAPFLVVTNIDNTHVRHERPYWVNGAWHSPNTPAPVYNCRAVVQSEVPITGRTIRAEQMRPHMEFFIFGTGGSNHRGMVNRVEEPVPADWSTNLTLRAWDLRHHKPFTLIQHPSMGVILTEPACAVRRFA